MVSRACRSARGLLLIAACVFLSSACKERYRVGDYVLVEWCDGAYPAYVLARKGPARYRVHFDGYDDRWDADIGIEEIKKRLDRPPETMPPLCPRVGAAMGIKSVKGKDNEPQTLYEVGAKVSVTWRGNVYKAIIIEVIDREHLKVHYEGHEDAWDEVITPDRIVKGR